LLTEVVDSGSVLLAEGGADFFAEGDDRIRYGPILAVPMRTPESVIGILVARRDGGDAPFQPSEAPLLTSFAEQATLALQLGEKNRAQRQLAVYADRDRIARDLHDHVIQRLFATGLYLQSSVRRGGHDVSARIQQAVEDLDTTVRDIRTAIFDLHTTGETDGAGLRRRLLDTATEAATGSTVVPTVRIAGPVDTVVSPEIGAHAVAVVREAISNAIQHGDPRTVVLTVEATDDLVIDVRDDGTGIVPEVARSGLRNLEDRARTCGGELTVRPEVPTGIRLTWRVPLA
jgi:signal transduction histidine kinase